jgi:hypothetical protein
VGEPAIEQARVAVSSFVAKYRTSKLAGDRDVVAPGANALGRHLLFLEEILHRLDAGAQALFELPPMHEALPDGPVDEAGARLSRGPLLGRTLARWRTEILNHRATGASNVPTEGLNLLVKKVKRAGHGFRSFANYRLRILLHAGALDWPASRPPAPRIRTRSPH